MSHYSGCWGCNKVLGGGHIECLFRDFHYQHYGKARISSIIRHRKSIEMRLRRNAFLEYDGDNAATYEKKNGTFRLAYFWNGITFLYVYIVPLQSWTQQWQIREGMTEKLRQFRKEMCNEETIPFVSGENKKFKYGRWLRRTFAYVCCLLFI